MGPPAPRRVQVVEYDPQWAATFSQLRGRLAAVVGELAISIEHVGSTAVEGLAAKPVLDIDIVIASLDVLPRVVEKLARAGYAHRGDLGIEGREAFAPPEGEPRHHLYVCAKDSVALRNHLCVRDHLRAHPRHAADYSALKKRLAAQYPDDMESYIAGKTGFLTAILARHGFPPETLRAIRRVNEKPPGGGNAGLSAHRKRR